MPPSRKPCAPAAWASSARECTALRARTGRAQCRAARPAIVARVWCGTPRAVASHSRCSFMPHVLSGTWRCRARRWWCSPIATISTTNASATSSVASTYSERRPCRPLPPPTLLCPQRPHRIARRDHVLKRRFFLRFGARLQRLARRVTQSRFAFRLSTR